MICSCRFASLRIFVQSLTPLQLPAATYRLSHSSLATSRQDGLVRSFKTASAAYSPRQRPHHVPRHDESPHLHDQDIHIPLNNSSNDHGAGPASYADSEVPVVELGNAKNVGAVFELSQDTIDSLSAETEHLSFAPDRHVKTGRNRADSPRSRSSLEKSNKPKEARGNWSKDHGAERNPDGRPRRKEAWQIQKEALKEKFPEGWAPRKRLSPDALYGIRALHHQFPTEYTTPVLADKFKVPVEAIRRILKAKWEPSPEQEEDRQARWFNRGKKIWSQMAELGKKPPKRWREEGITRDPRWNKKRGPRTEYPYVPKWQEAQAKKEAKESTQRKLGGNLL